MQKCPFSLIAAVFLAMPALADSGQSGAAKVEISHFSGKPVPRFENFRFAAVNGREGPSESHRILWRYERAGLPVLIVKESRNWRRVRDPDGDEVWVHARMLAPDRRALCAAMTASVTSSCSPTRGTHSRGGCPLDEAGLRAGTMGPGTLLLEELVTVDASHADPT